MKKTKKDEPSSKMMDELSQLKIYGGREEVAAKWRLTMKNCTQICVQPPPHSTMDLMED